MKKTIEVCDLCEKEIKDTQACYRFSIVERKLAFDPKKGELVICGICSEYLQLLFDGDI